MLNRLSVFIATVCYVGYIPVGPGTFGSIATLLPIALFFKGNALVETGLCLATFIVGVWASKYTAEAKGHPDPPYVVIDEVCGMFVTFLMIPVSAYTLIWGFIFFRCFDIFKLPPIRRLEKIPNGFGIMLDDVAAGLLSNLALRLLLSI